MGSIASVGGRELAGGRGAALTGSRASPAVHDDLVQRVFTAPAPDLVWSTDITELERWGQSHQRSAPLATADVRAVLIEGRRLVWLLASADRAERAALYRELGLTLRYEKEAPTGLERVHARLELCGGGGRI